MKHSKKILVLLLTFVLAFGVLAVSANADIGIASGDGWSANANSDFCNETHASAGDFIASHNELPNGHSHGSTYYNDYVGSFYGNNVTVSITGSSTAADGVHYIGAGYGYHHWWTSSGNYGTDYASVNYNLTGGTLVIDNGSDYTSYVTGPANGTGNLLVLSGKVYVKGTFGNIATGEGATVILNGDTTVNGTSVSYYGTTYSEANITGGTWFHDCSVSSTYDTYVPAGLTVNDGDVTIADGSPVLQYLVVSDGEVDLNGVGIENVDRHNGCSHTVVPSGSVGLSVSSSGKVTSSSSATNTATDNHTIVGKTYGIEQTGGTIELTDYTITDTWEIGNGNYAGGAIYTNYTGSSSGDHTTLTDCNIYTVGGEVASYSSYDSSHQLNEDLSTIVVDDGYVTIISDSGPNYIKGSYNLIDYTGTLTDSYAYNTALEVNGGEVTVTNMAIDSASSSTIPVKVQNATVTLNGTTVVGGTTTPGTAITVKNTSDKTAKLTLDDTVVVNAFSIGIDADDSGTTITMKAGTIQYGDSGRVDYGIDADYIAEIEITGGTINAKYCGIDANTVPDFSVENATIDVSNSGISYGICANNCGSTTPVLIKDSTITVASNDKNDYACGLYLGSTVLKIENTDTTGKTEITVTADDEHNHAYGVYVDSSEFTMNAGTTITAKVGNSLSNAYGIYNGGSKVTVNDGTIIADVTANTVTNASVYGIYNKVSEGNIGVIVNDAEITVGETFGKGSNVKDVAYGMYNELGKLRMCGGTVNVYSDGSADSYGAYVYNGDIEMLGGTIKLMNEHEDGVFVKNGQFIMGTWQQSTLPTELGAAWTSNENLGYPYIVYAGTTNNKVFGIDATGGTTYLYAGNVDVSKKSGFHAVHVDGGQVVIWLNENVNPAYDTDDTTMFTAVANASEGAAFYAKTGNWQIRGTGALFEAKVAFYANAGTAGNFSGGTFKGEMQYTAGNIDTLFAVNHYLRNDGEAGKAGIPTDGTALVSAAAKTIDNANYYTVTDAEWELRYALEQNNSINTYTMPVDIVLNDNTGIWGAMANWGGVDVPTAGTFVLNMNDKTLSTSAKGSTFANAESHVIMVGTVGNNGGNLTINGTTVTEGVPTSTIKSGQKIATGNSSKDEAVIWNWGTLTLNKVTVDGTDPDVFRGVYSNKSATITECVIKTDVVNGIGVLVQNGTADITDSAISGDHAAIETEGGTTNIKNTAGKTTTVSTVGSHYAIDADRGTVNLQGTDDAGVVVNGSTYSMLSNAIINVYHATFNGDVDAYQGTINIYGGSFPKGDSASCYKLIADMYSTNAGTINIKKDSAEDAVAPTIARDVIVKEDAKLNVYDGSTIQGTVSTAGTTYVYNGTFEDTFTVTAGTTTIDNGIFNEDVTFTGGTTTIYGGSFKSGEPFTVNGGTVEVKTASAEGATAPTIDRDITVSGGSLTVDNGTVNGKVEKTDESTGTVTLKVGTSYKTLTNNENGETIADMLDSAVTYIRDGVETNVIERNNAGTTKTVTNDTDNTKYLVLCGENVTNIEIKDTHDNAASSVAYSRGDLATALGGSAKTITLKATENSTATVRELRWTVAASDGGDANKVTVANADVRIGNTNTINVASDAPAGTYTIMVSDLDSSDTAASATYTITISKINLATDTKVTVSATDQTYTAGQSKTTTVTVKYNGYTIGDSDYDLGGTTTATDKGSYNASVTAKAESLDITGSKTASWQIKDTVTPPSGGGVSSYAVTVESAKNGTFSTDKKSASAGSTVTVTVAPDKGFTLETLTVTDMNGKEVEVKNLGENKYSFKMPSSKVTVSATFTEVKTACPQDETCVYAKFTDADTKAWYHDGVHFCVENGYMQGVSDVLFAPDGTTTRAMIVTMLWRMEGEPVVNYAMSFKDVSADQWYTEAIRWAQSNKIVEGYSAEAFGPDDPITREQMATILYHYAKYHSIDVANTNTLAGFTDVNKVSAWALDAMKWANTVGLVQGRTATTLAPEVRITREEAATMVQRYCEAFKK